MRNLETLHALSPAQQGTLFHAVSSPEAADLYVCQLVAVLPEDVDCDALEAAFQHVVDRHPALRTSLVWEGLEEPVQAVRVSARLPRQRRSWSEAKGKNRDRQLRDFLREDREAGLRPSDCPPMRLTILEFGDGRARTSS